MRRKKFYESNKIQVNLTLIKKRKVFVGNGKHNSRKSRNNFQNLS